MSTTILQVPMDADLKAAALQGAKKLGFSSLQEAFRIFATKLSKNQLSLSISEKSTVQLSAKAIKRYEKMDHDFAAGKYTEANSTEELFKQLGV